MSSKGWKILLLISTVALSSFGHSEKWFKIGNTALAEQRYEEARDAYHEAVADAPEEAVIYYNLATAHYRMGAFQEAVASYEYAASMAKTDSMRSRSWYNIGNCMVKTSKGLREADPQAAASYCTQAAWFYRMALDYDASFRDAAYNLEITQWIAAGIEEDIRKKNEDEQQQNELVTYIRETLQEFIERQTKLLELNDTGERQQQLEIETRELAAVMEQSGLHTDIPLPDGTSLPGPLNETWEHTTKAAAAMALPNQPIALAELIRALESAPEDPNQQEGESDDESDDYDMEYEVADEDADIYEVADPFGDFSDYEEIRGVPPPNQTEMDILAEEVRNQERRKDKKAGKYKAVEKDW